MRRTTATVAPWPAHPTIGQRGACFRGQYGSQLPHPETGHLVEQVRPHPAGPQTLQCPGFVVDERRQPPPDRPTMPGLVLGSRTMIAMSTAQQRPPRRKLVLPQPQPGLPRARDRPGRQIHHNEPQTGHRLNHIPSRLDDRHLPEMLEEPLPRLPAVPTRVTDGQVVSECRQVRQTTIDVEITTRSVPLTSPTQATGSADMPEPRPP